MIVDLFLLLALLPFAAFAGDSGIKEQFRKQEKPPQLQVKPSNYDREVANGALCTFCTTTIGGIRDYIKDHEGDVPSVVDAICKEYFEGHPAEMMLCESLVKTELPAIIKYIEDGLDPAAICGILKFC